MIKEIMKTRSRLLRNNSTDSENYLWYFLRSRNLNGYKFKRQFIIGTYIVDFVCLHKKLIVELDGGQHEQTIRYDTKRDAYLKAEGYRVLRFWNTEVLTEIDEVLEVILDTLNGSPSP